ncbi:MAG: thioesterase domain-containing protein, partial [Bacteroidota bacterium]
LEEIFLPALKNDFKIMETAIYEKEIQVFPCDISILVGKDDDLTVGEREGWIHYTNLQCSFHHFEGGHFYLLDKVKSVVDLINLTWDQKRSPVDLQK